MKPIISVEGLGKSYTIRHEGKTRYKSLREEIFKLPKRLLQRNSQSQEEFWALKDVSFDVMPGDRVGIIGRNGAGKSTLLKLLSRITEPTTGRITLRGRVASLLEVGTGFHPELTGRENIFLNGAILGMSRAEVRCKFDEIVDFAGVERFLDTPVKRYSSGMYVRLAFAVAAHLEPEILIVDEVLAVGDAEFQEKCLGKMEEVSKGEGRTVLFVSHNMAMISKLCAKGIWLKSGEYKFYGPMQGAVQKYRDSLSDVAKIIKKQIDESKEAQFICIYTSDIDGKPSDKFVDSDSVCLSATIYSPNDLYKISFSLSLYDQNRTRIFTIHEHLKTYELKDSILNLRVVLSRGFIVPGTYSWIICLSIPGSNLYDLQDDVCRFVVEDAGSEFAMFAAGTYGSVRPAYTIQQIVSEDERT